MVEEVAMALAFGTHASSRTVAEDDGRMVDFSHLSFQRIMGPHWRVVGFSSARLRSVGQLNLEIVNDLCPLRLRGSLNHK